MLPNEIEEQVRNVATRRRHAVRTCAAAQNCAKLPRKEKRGISACGRLLTNFAAKEKN